MSQVSARAWLASWRSSGAITTAQQQRPPAAGAAERAPTVDDFRRTVSNLKGNRIATPNNYDTLSAEQKAYVASILSGPRSSITGPLGVMMVAPDTGRPVAEGARLRALRRPARVLERPAEAERARDPGRGEALVG